MCDRTGHVKLEMQLKNTKEMPSCPEYEVMPSINKDTQATIGDAVKMEENPAYGVSMSTQATTGEADDAVKMQDNPAYDVTIYN